MTDSKPVTISYDDINANFIFLRLLYKKVLWANFRIYILYTYWKMIRIPLIKSLQKSICGRVLRKALTMKGSNTPWNEVLPKYIKSYLNMSTKASFDTSTNCLHINSKSP